MVNRRWFALALIIHAVIHGLAFQAAWGIGSREEFSAVPAFPALPAGSPAVRALGALWLVAGVGFLITAWLVVREHGWWRAAGAGSALVSLAACILWWHDAAAGTSVDIALLAGIAVSGVRSVRITHLAASAPPVATHVAGRRGYGTIRTS